MLSQLTTLGQTDQLPMHVRSARQLGLRESEIAEVFVQLGGYAGFPRALSAMRVAQEVFAEQGGSRKAAAEPAEKKDDGQRRSDAREVMGRLTANQPAGGLDTGMRAFTGTAGRWAFGELWSREALTRRQRSLVVVATLLAQDKMNELRFHLRAAQNHGLTVEELEEVMITTIAYVGFPTGVEGVPDAARGGVAERGMTRAAMEPWGAHSHGPRGTGERRPFRGLSANEWAEQACVPLHKGPITTSEKAYLAPRPTYSGR